MPKKKPKKVDLTPKVEELAVTPYLGPKEPIPSKIKQWLDKAPPPIEGQPPLREYGEWLTKYKAWMAEGEKLA